MPSFVPLPSPPLRHWLSPITATPARHRMAVVVVTVLISSFATVGSEVILPLWVTRELGYSPGDWAQMRSLRMWGVVGGVVFLGTLCDRFGQRIVGAIGLFCAGIALGWLAVGESRSIWFLMPLLGATMSTAFVSLNVLTQQVSTQRPGLANTIYRGTGAAIAIAAPIAVTALAILWRGYEGVFLLIGALLILSAVSLCFYPEENNCGQWRGLRHEARRAWNCYADAMRQRELMRFLHVASLWYAVLAGVSAFAALRFTRELGQSDQQFGALTSVAAIATLLVTLAGGFLLDRVALKHLHVAVCTVASACALLMGVSDSLTLSGVGYVLSIALMTGLVGASSIWVSRSAGPQFQSAGFTAHKVMGAFYVAVVMAALGLLEHWLSLRTILLGVGACGLLLAATFAFLQEPAKPSAPAERVPTESVPAENEGAA